MKQLTKLKGLYLITDEKLIEYDKLEDYLKPALAHGASIIQLRDKTHSIQELFPIALRLKALCRRYDSLFIINDNPDLALEVDADGVHIGKDDSDIDEVKKRLPDKIIGVSCYNDLKKARLMEQEGASYVAFGSFYPSPTKPKAELADKRVLQEAKQTLSIPICAIGGITAENAGELIALGADMVAVISDIFASPSIALRTAQYQAFFATLRL